MTELEFLVDVLLNEKLTKSTKERISERIKYVAKNYNNHSLITPQVLPVATPVVTSKVGAAMVRTTTPKLPAVMLKHPDLIAPEIYEKAEEKEQLPELEVIAPENIAKTPAAVQALVDRKAMMARGKQRPPITNG